MKATGGEVVQLGKVLDFMRLIWALDHGLQSLSKRMQATLGLTGPQRVALRVLGRESGRVDVDSTCRRPTPWRPSSAGSWPDSRRGGRGPRRVFSMRWQKDSSKRRIPRRPELKRGAFA